MEWIDINEEIPEFMETVLLAYGGHVTVGWRESEEFEELDFFSCENRDWPENVTHWMPIPEGPSY